MREMLEAEPKLSSTASHRVSHNLRFAESLIFRHEFVEAVRYLDTIIAKQVHPSLLVLRLQIILLSASDPLLE